ncbi:hypothetical protein JAAARDRAFT_608335 [Jaapia argillacea MUCL 33604]|uniref:Uncharacterized protein n=1 Tax=Jaapia argillacea MUCL 33604 TaxID=933084 RepID=A0A067QD40_9AGAM|nr:hypothetical protein JAAARDRAFT_608335 [Jaapia argillacea MUCL 33604]
MGSGEAIGGFILILLWLGINCADAAWIYFYIQSEIFTNPHNAIDRTESGWTGYTVMMFIFGFFWGLINAFPFWAYFFSGGVSSGYGKSTLLNTLWTFWNIFVMFPVALLMILCPFFGPFVGLSVAEKWAWDHGCDGYPISVIIDAQGYDAPPYYPNVVHYYLYNNPVYSYDIFQQSADFWSFGLRTVDSSALSENESDPHYPSIHSIGYDFVSNTITGNCTSPATGNTTTTPCISGSFNPTNDYLSFNLTDSRDSSSTSLRAVDKQWTFDTYPPNAILKDGNGQTVLRTDITRRSDCTLLKVCIGRNDPGAETIAPIGLVLLMQMDYAVSCTTPND